jgi:hypothetical protein
MSPLETRTGFFSVRQAMRDIMAFNGETPYEALRTMLK